VADRSAEKTAAVFLDRDGTIIEDAHYIRRVEDVRLLAGAAEGLRRMQAAGYALVVVSNQSGLARGIISEEEHGSVRERFVELLKGEGIELTDYFYCPHHPEGVVEKYRQACECRKGRPGMLLEAARRHGLSMTGSWMIGDKAADVEAGIGSGVRTIRIGRAEAAEEDEVRPEFYADNLVEAARIIVDGELG
jgi:D,D-heptose 1,7-bisphosphate phosphatase